MAALAEASKLAARLKDILERSVTNQRKIQLIRQALDDYEEALSHHKAVGDNPQGDSST